MGNVYTAPKKQGSYPFTRSGIAPPETVKKSGSDDPLHRINDPMSLEMHMSDIRARTAGMSDAEREWRRKVVNDRNLHPDEPIHVDAVHRQLNPIRILYRYPWDALYQRFLQPTFGVYYGTGIRMFVPKFLMALIFLELGYYQWKYSSKSWQRLRGIDTATNRFKDETVIEGQDGQPSMSDPAKYRYFSRTWANRTSHFDVEKPTKAF